MRRWAAGLVLGVCVAAGAAHAQTTSVSISPTTNAPALGNVVRGPSSTTFTINPTSGAVSQAGPAIRLTSASVSTPTVTIACNSGLCNSRQIAVTISSIGTNPTLFSRFSVGGLTCAPGCSAAFVGSTSGTPPFTFNISGVGNNKTTTFKLGSDVTVSSVETSGAKSFGIKVDTSLQ